MRSLSRFLAALLVLAQALTAAAQQRLPRTPAPERTIRGKVLVAGSNRPMRGVYVALVSDGGGSVMDTRTGPNGQFVFDNISAGVYFVTAELPGYHKASQRFDLTINPRGYALLALYPKKDSKEAASTPEEGVVPLEALAVPEEAKAEFEKSKSLLKKGKLEDGQQHLREAIRLYPDYYQAHLLLGTSLTDQRQWKEAEQALLRSLQINERFAPSYFALGLLYKQQGKIEDARTALENGLRAAPDSGEGHIELAEILLAQGEVEEAEIHARRAHTLDEKEPLPHAVLGNILLREGDPIAAREEYQHFLDLAPDNPLAHQVREKITEIDKKERTLALVSSVPPKAQREFAKGKQSLDNREVEKALKQFHKAIELHPGYVEAHHMVGTILMDQQKWSEAEKSFKHCLELNDHFPLSYIALGTLYNLTAKPAEAIPVLQRGLELDPNAWQGHFELAQSLLTQRKLGEAEFHARRAHDLLSSDLLVHVLLGNIGLSKHDLPLARQEYQHYLDLAPGGPLAPQLMVKIEQIDSRLGRAEASKP